MEEGSTIAFNASINMAVGHPELIDYTATKGAMIGFMRALSNQIVGDKGIRCNAVAPGPIWSPLMYVGSSFACCIVHTTAVVWVCADLALRCLACVVLRL